MKYIFHVMFKLCLTDSGMNSCRTGYYSASYTSYEILL